MSILFSSIGMAKAALEAMNGFNLYGDKGANWSVVYVDVVCEKTGNFSPPFEWFLQDAHNRNRTTFDTLLPRESASKVIICLFVFREDVSKVSVLIDRIPMLPYC